MPARRGGCLLDEPPGTIHASVESLPGLAMWRRIVQREHVEAELGVGRATDITEVALLEERIMAHGGTRCLLEALGSGRRACEITRENGRDAGRRIAEAGQDLILDLTELGRGEAERGHPRRHPEGLADVRKAAEHGD